MTLQHHNPSGDAAPGGAKAAAAPVATLRLDLKASKVGHVGAPCGHTCHAASTTSLGPPGGRWALTPRAANRAPTALHASPCTLTMPFVQQCLQWC